MAVRSSSPVRMFVTELCLGDCGLRLRAVPVLHLQRVSALLPPRTRTVLNGVKYLVYTAELKRPSCGSLFCCKTLLLSFVTLLLHY